MGQFLTKLKSRRESTISITIRKQTKDFARVWLLFCDRVIIQQTAKQLNPSLYRDHWLFRNETGVEFYETRWTNRQHKYPSRLGRALITDNTCLDSVYVTFDKISQPLSCVQIVEWITVNPRPRLVLIRKQVVRAKEEILHEHDCIRITALDNSRYVLDLSGWQFGYDDYFFTWEEYKSKCMAPESPTTVRNPVVENIQIAERYSGYPSHLETIQLWKHNVTQASDRKLRRMTRGIKLTL
ncbi:uncharacterized protein N0V89_000512 [Didymosphaeria variabile]|uniref:Uncharacterized protein n=1 Tax=Didymosphaeria variabile TaxID=1932322 RepID=A0A9W8XUU0_9PLEO|nr:uncharacterized protein N0V89_000512 [Didymosphaeria variabile]KAJ4359953.1 hypothetical protein N0V89_000512 [Didymosphaeria variabile]